MNEENNMMVTEMTNEEPEMFEESSGMSTGMAMLTGSLLTLATIAIVKKAREVWANHSAKKGLSDEIDESKVVDITEDVEEVNKAE